MQSVVQVADDWSRAASPYIQFHQRRLEQHSPTSPLRTPENLGWEHYNDADDEAGHSRVQVMASKYLDRIRDSRSPSPVRGFHTRGLLLD